MEQHVSEQYDSAPEIDEAADQVQDVPEVVEADETVDETLDAATDGDVAEEAVADTEVEEVLVAALRKAFPEDGVVCEEGTVVQGGPSTWYVDPIDCNATWHCCCRVASTVADRCCR